MLKLLQRATVATKERHPQIHSCVMLSLVIVYASNLSLVELVIGAWTGISTWTLTTIMAVQVCINHFGYTIMY